SMPIDFDQNGGMTKPSEAKSRTHGCAPPIVRPDDRQRPGRNTSPAPEKVLAEHWQRVPLEARRLPRRVLKSLPVEEARGAHSFEALPREFDGHEPLQPSAPLGSRQGPAVPGKDLPTASLDGETLPTHGRADNWPMGHALLRT